MSKESFWNRPITREEFIEKAAGTAFIAAGVVAGRNTGEQVHDFLGPDGLKLNPLLSDNNSLMPFTQTQHHELLSDGRKFITIRHGAGDNLNDIEEADRSGADFADFNLKLINEEMVATHAKTIFNAFGELVLDYDSKTSILRFMPQINTLEEIMQEASRAGIGLFGEFNEGAFNHSHVEELIRLANKYDVKLMMHAQMEKYGNLIQYGREIDTNPQNWLDVPMGIESWERFKAINGPKGALTDFRSAEVNSDYLTDAFVIIGNIKTQEDYNRALNLPVVNGTLLYDEFTPERNTQ